MDLISMKDFVLKVLSEDRPCDRGKILDEIGSYAKFLDQPLELGMFIPCVDGVPIEEPKMVLDENNMYKTAFESLKQYRQAKERVLFEGVDFLAKNKYTVYLKIKGNTHAFYLESKMLSYLGEDLEIIDGLSNLDITLTKTALKQLQP